MVKAKNLMPLFSTNKSRTTFLSPLFIATAELFISDRTTTSIEQHTAKAQSILGKGKG